MDMNYRAAELVKLTSYKKEIQDMLKLVGDKWEEFKKREVI